jgi:phosphatidylserine decarboxylase
MLRFTRHGLWEMLIGSLLLIAMAAVLGYFVVWPWMLVVLPVLVWLLAFFRDPQRAIPADEHIMVSPADGKVSDITQIENDKLLGGPAIRVGIFLSVFNVHMNRSPCDGKVLAVTYRKGRFINAMNHSAASEENECNTVVLGDAEDGRPIAVVRQIVGLIARRIVCTLAVDDRVERGQRIGMIKFGSRTELYIPLWLKPRLKVTVGQTVRGAADVVAVLENPIHATRQHAKAEAGAAEQAPDAE